MRKFLAAFVGIILLSAFMYAYAEDDFIEYADSFLMQASDNLSDKQSHVLKASGTSPDVGEIMFDFTDGNKTLLAIADEKCKVYAFFDDDELLGVLYRMLTQFMEIERHMPQGKRLEYTIRLSEDNTIVVTQSNIMLFLRSADLQASNGQTAPAAVPADEHAIGPTLVSSVQMATAAPEPTAEPKATSIPDAPETKTVFLPSYMIRTYNENIGSFFEVTSDADHSLFDTYFSVSLKDSSDGKLVYTNSDSMIKITYASADPNSIADEMTFWTSHEYDYRNIPQFCFAWAVISNFIDDIYDMDFFLWLNGAKNGDTFSCDAFSAVYIADPDHFSSFVLTRK